MPRARRTAQTEFEKDDEFQVEKILAKKLLKVSVEASSSTQKAGKKQVRQKESVMHYEVKWWDYEETTWEPVQCEISRGISKVGGGLQFVGNHTVPITNLDSCKELVQEFEEQWEARYNQPPEPKPKPKPKPAAQTINRLGFFWKPSYANRRS
jgi:hypothetical protein